jgi:hypothetical protein
VLPRNTFLIYGDSRSGKTTFAATFPRPLFLSDVTEGGWDSIANMTDDQFFEPGVKPIVWGIEKMDDMVKAREKALPLILNGRVQTIVVDSLSFYCDLYLNYIVMSQSKKDKRTAYGDLGDHLRDLRVKTHTLGDPTAQNLTVNVVWLCLAKTDEESSFSRPMIPGQQADKFMAGVHFIFHARSYQDKRGLELMPPVYEMRTKKGPTYLAGSRLGGRDLLDPLIGDYQTFIEALGHNADEVRKQLPKLIAVGSQVMSQAKPVALAAPPIVRTPAAVVRRAVAPAKSPA